MALSRARRSGGNHALFWPGYVDVFATLLLVVTFLLSVFMVAQFYISQESTGKDTVLRRLQRQIAELTNLLSLEKGQGKTLQDELASLQANFATLRADNERLAGIAGASGDKDARIAALSKELADKSTLSADAQARVDLLNQQLLQLRRQMAALQEAIGAWEAKDKESQARISDLGARLNIVLAKQVQELQRYRSDFFGRLRELLRDRKDIRVVGDRFVFESEVLFPSGQATMTVEGLAADGRLTPLQQAFVELGAAQCGYCTPGILLTAQALLAAVPVPTRDQVKDALAGNLCRCTGYTKILDAVELAVSLQILGKRGERSAELRQKARMRRRLVGVRIETVEGHIIDARRQAGVDKLRDLPELRGQRRGRVSDRCPVGLTRRFDPAAYVQGGGRAGLHKLEQVAAAGARDRERFVNRGPLPVVAARIKFELRKRADGWRRNIAGRQRQRLAFLAQVQRRRIGRGA